MKKFLLAALLLFTSPALAQNVFFPASPGDMIVKGATTWGPVPGGTAGCVLMSQGPTAAPTWSCALPLNFSLPPIATNRVWGNVSGTQAIPSPITVNQFLDTVGYDTLRTPTNGSMLVKEPATGTWQALTPSVNAGWVLTSAGAFQTPVWAFVAGSAAPGATGTCLVSNGPTVSPTYQSCLTGLGLTMTNGQLLVGQTSALPLPKTVGGDATMDLNAAFTLATVNGNVGTFGSSSAIPIITVNAKGLITAVTTAAPTGSTVNWTPTGTGGTSRTIASTLQERGVTPTDYGAVPNSNTAGVPAANATAFTRAFAASPKVYCKQGETYYAESIVVPTTAMSLSNCSFTAGGSYGANTAVLSVTNNAAGLVIDGVTVSVDVSTYTTTNGIALLNTTNATLSNSSPSGIYPVYVAGKSLNTRIIGNTLASGTFGRGIFATSDGSAARTFTVTSASPAVFTRVAHGLAVNDTVILYTTGSLYTGLTRGRLYYVKTVPTADTFTVSLTAGGVAVNTSGAQSGTHYFTSNGPVGLYIGSNTLYKSASVNSQGIVLIGVGDATVTNNIILGSAHFGISSGLGEHNSITDNNVSSAAKEAIHTDSGVNAIISGNVATFDATSTDVGFSVSSDNGPPAVNTQVIGNSIDSPFGTGIYLVGANGVSVQGNKIRNANVGNTSLSASIALDGTLTVNNLIGPNTIEDTVGNNLYQVGEANYTSGTPSANYIAQQLGKMGTTGYILNVATTNTMVRAQNSPASSDTVGGFWFGSSAFAKRDTGGSSVYLYDFANTLVGSFSSTLNNWGNTKHTFSSRGFGGVYASIEATGWNWTNVAAPATPAAGTAAVYTDSTSKKLCSKDDAGAVGCTTSQGAWTTYTPTLSCGSGTLTSATATGAYKQDGKSVTFRAIANITTNGTCAGRLEATLPIATSAGLSYQSLSGTNFSSGAVLSSSIIPSVSTTKVLLFTATATYPGADVTVLGGQGTYEVP